MNENIQAAVDRLQQLIDYSTATGTQTSYTQGRILRRYSAEDQELIISKLRLPIPAALTGAK